jgi:putative transposase
MREIQFFDPRQDVSVIHKRLPHWSQAGTVAFITWRTADSLPTAMLERLARERSDLLQRFGIADADWEQQVAKLSAVDRGKLQWSLFEAWDRQLDAAAGDCVLARPELSAMVAESLFRFDDDRYLLTNFVVMPNHVHLLAAFQNDETMLAQCLVEALHGPPD